MKIIIVNDQDEVIGAKERSEAAPTDITRISAIYIYNSKNEVLLARRAFDKLYYPGKWGVSAAGTIEEGETYESNIIKETAEELGVILEKNDLTFGKHGYISDDHNYFYQVYFAKKDIALKDIKIQIEEVAEVRWFPIEELLAELKNHPKEFTPAFHHNFKYFLDFFYNH